MPQCWWSLSRHAAGPHAIALQSPSNMATANPIVIRIPLIRAVAMRLGCAASLTVVDQRFSGWCSHKKERTLQDTKTTLSLSSLIMPFDESFDPTDLEFQVDPAFLPDKEKTWKHPAELDGWPLVHEALKKEIRNYDAALDETLERSKSTGLREWEVDSLQTALLSHSDHVHWHHSDEDDNVVPHLKKRFKYPERLEAAHPEIEAKFDKIKKMFMELKTGDKLDIVSKEWKEYADMIIPHMDEEDRFALPLLRAYFTAEDMAPVIAHIMKHGPKIEMGSLIHSVGGEAPFRNGFMAREGIPFFAWYIHFRSCADEFQDRFVKHVEALKVGKKPEEQPSFWCTIS